MKPMTIKEYLAQNSPRCPFCHSEDIEGDRFDALWEEAWQEMSCITCQKEWLDVYKLSGYEKRDD